MLENMYHHHRKGKVFPLQLGKAYVYQTDSGLNERNFDPLS
uniref:Uncharacterized protein n=1 Tax=Bacillus cereus TaxID=1396 RepID=A1BZ68_BACCE|nr:hypothetical protein pPER272_AH820_0038 [Bacillus cereus]ABK01186.1 hypothetical protein pPER272_0038 [Bacillus cereus]